MLVGDYSVQGQAYVMKMISSHECKRKPFILNLIREVLFLFFILEVGHNCRKKYRDPTFEETDLTYDL